MFDRPVREIALVNPPWEFEGSRFWGCREPHIPLELLYAEALLEESGFASTVVDAHLEAYPWPRQAGRSRHYARI